MAVVPAWEWVTIAVCILLSGFFSGSETAYISLSKAKFHALLDARKRNRDPLAIWLEKPSALLTAILIGNNLVNIGASALATDIAARIFRSQGLAVAVGVMTLVILVVGEITPKVMARRYAQEFVTSSAYLLAAFYYLCWPFTRIFGAFTHLLIRLTGGDPDQDFSTVEADELEMQVEMSAREGGIEKLPASLIGKVFRFHDKSIKDAMVPRTAMVALELEDGAWKIMETANRSGHSRLPVYRETQDEIVGVFHVKDLLSEPVDRWGQFVLADHLNPPYFVPESVHLGDALKEFQRRRIHLAIVVDEFGGTEGVITLEDILEELVGEIQDEFDRDVVMMRRLPSGALEVSGRTPVEDLENVFSGWAEEVPAKTVGGLVMEITGKVPVPGESVSLEGLRFTVLRSNERQILKVRVEDRRESDAGSS
jgi:CBS domain containing-hemolysin-like protein